MFSGRTSQLFGLGVFTILFGLGVFSILFGLGVFTIFESGKPLNAALHIIVTKGKNATGAQ